MAHKRQQMDKRQQQTREDQQVDSIMRNIFDTAQVNPEMCAIDYDRLGAVIGDQIGAHMPTVVEPEVSAYTPKGRFTHGFRGDGSAAARGSGPYPARGSGNEHGGRRRSWQ